MPLITWLHISDLHFRKSQAYDENVVLKALLRDLVEQQVHPDFIVVSGDIAFSGQPAEYDLARRFFDELLPTVGLGKERLFVVPGNHDVDRKLISSGARAIGDSLADREKSNDLLSTPSDRKLVFARFKAYAAFVKAYLGRERRFDDSHYFYVQSLDLAGQRVALLGLNSAWLCASDEDKANGLLMGERQVRTALEQAESANLKIALLHHPFDWLREFDQSDSAAMLTDGCDFILHGHLHQTAATQLMSPDGAAMILACGACYETREFPNMYNWVLLDLAAGTGTVHLRRYSDARGGFWAKDTLTYRNAPDGTYAFFLRHEAGESGASSTSPPPIRPTKPPLPQSPRFLDRESEIDTLTQYMYGHGVADPAGPVTIYGLPGMGKTELAIYLHGLFRAHGLPLWVDGSDLQDYSVLYQRIQQTGIMDLSSTQPVLLILDGVEHFHRKLSPVLSRLARQNQIKIILTTRTAGVYPGQPTIEVGPLPPDAARDLFLEYWKGRETPLPDEQIAYVDWICGSQVLDGHPLFIRIAAAAAGIRRDLSHFVSGVRNAMNQDSISSNPTTAIVQEMVGQYCADLLDDDSRGQEAHNLLARLSAVPGEFTKTFIERLVQVPPTLDKAAIEELIDRCWLSPGRTANRYRLHSVVRAGANKYLQALPERQAVLSFVGKALLRKESRDHWLIGVTRLLEAQEWAQVLRVAKTKFAIEENRAIFSGYGGSDELLQVRAHWAMAYLHYERGDQTKGVEYARAGRQVLALSTTIPPLEKGSLDLRLLAVVGREYIAQEQHEAAEDAIALAEEIIAGLSAGQIDRLQWEIAQIYLLKGIFLCYSESDEPGGATARIEQAREYTARALAIYTTLGDERQIVRALSNAATIADDLGDIETAIDTSRRILFRVSSATYIDPFTFAVEYANLVDSLHKQGRFDEAVTWVTQGLAFCEAHGLLYPHVVMLINSAMVDIEVQKYEAAQQSLTMATSLRLAMGDPLRLKLLTKLNFARAYLGSGEFHRVQREVDEVLDCGQSDIEAEAFRIQGLLQLTQGQPDAESSFLASLDRCERISRCPFYYRGRTYLDLARFYRQAGADKKMQGCLQKARTNFEQIKADYYLEQIDELQHTH